MIVRLIRHFRALVLLLLTLTLAQPNALADMDDVRADLRAGRADSAIHKLKAADAPDLNTAEWHNLICRVYLTEERWNDAVKECEQAVRLAPDSSEYHLWLGRAYGEKADRSSFISAYSLAKRVRAEFEAAVNADPRNLDALSDLGEFYAEAPALVGGGTDKAQVIAQRLDGLDAVRAHTLRAQIAQQVKNYPLAEAELKAAIAASPKPASQWMSLASFYRKRGRWDDMLAAIHSGIAADKEHSVALADGASVLIRSNREPELAVQMLESYLASPKKSEDAPAFAVRIQLAKLKQQLGDSAGAKSETTIALALASDYRPAQTISNTGR